MADSPGDPDALQRDIDGTREELARTIDEIVDRVHPKRVARRRVEIFRENAQHFRETAGARMSLDGARPVGGPKALTQSEGTDDATGDAEGHLGTTTYAVRNAKVPLIAGAGVLLIVTAAAVVWRMRRR